MYACARRCPEACASSTARALRRYALPSFSVADLWLTCEEEFLRQNRTVLRTQWAPPISSPVQAVHCQASLQIRSLVHGWPGRTSCPVPWLLAFAYEEVVFAHEGFCFIQHPRPRDSPCRPAGTAIWCSPTSVYTVYLQAHSYLVLNAARRMT